jgi:hypothetical protein
MACQIRKLGGAYLWDRAPSAEKARRNRCLRCFLLSLILFLATEPPHVIVLPTDPMVGRGSQWDRSRLYSLMLPLSGQWKSASAFLHSLLMPARLFPRIRVERLSPRWRTRGIAEEKG